MTADSLDLYLRLLGRTLPLYGLVVLGFAAGRWLAIERRSIAFLLIYIITPVVAFRGVLRTPISAEMLSLPLVFLALGTLLCLLTLKLTSRFWHDGREHIAAFCAGTGNTGYFGIPVAVMLFGDEVLGQAILCSLGLTLFENSFGGYIAARGQLDRRQAVRTILRLPSLYAMALAFLCQRWGLKLAPEWETVTAQFTGTYSVLGMLLLGSGLAALRRTVFDPGFMAYTLTVKAAAWPAAMLCWLFLSGRIALHYDPITARVMLFMAIVPIAVSTLVWAEIFGLHPDKMALTVLLSTLVGAILVPLAALVRF